VLLLKEGADHTLRNAEDMLAIDLAPDKDVRTPSTLVQALLNTMTNVTDHVLSSYAGAPVYITGCRA
jgi:hypothetical protein